MRNALLVGLVVTLGWAASAGAQSLPLDGKLYVDVNALYQAATRSVDQRGTLSLYGEDGTVEASQRIGAGALWDVGFGYTVWRDLAVGLDISQFSRHQTISATGTAPHPLFFNSPRAFSAETSSSHKARTIAVLASWRFRTRGALEKLNVRVMGGPAALHVQQGLAADVTLTEGGFPYETVSASVATRTSSKNRVGFVGGVDVGYELLDNVGVGVLLRYAGGSAKLDEPLGGGTITVKAGGFQIGGGVRLKF